MIITNTANVLRSTPCCGRNCTAIEGVGHSPECKAAQRAAYKPTPRLSDAAIVGLVIIGVLVGLGLTAIIHGLTGSSPAKEAFIRKCTQAQIPGGTPRWLPYECELMWRKGRE